MPMTQKMTIDSLESRSPNSLQHARAILTNAINSAEKMLGNIEKQFYGGKNSKAEIGKKARLITKVHVSVQARHMVITYSL